MSRGTHYPPELRERADRMVSELTPDYPTEWAAMRSVAEKLGIGSVETVRKWVRRAQVDAGDRPGITIEDHAEIKRLKRENAELRRAHEIPKAASSFFAAELCATRRRVCREVVRDHFRWARAAVEQVAQLCAAGLPAGGTSVSIGFTITTWQDPPLSLPEDTDRGVSPVHPTGTPRRLMTFDRHVGTQQGAPTIASDD